MASFAVEEEIGRGNAGTKQAVLDGSMIVLDGQCFVNPRAALVWCKSQPIANRYALHTKLNYLYTDCTTEIEKLLEESLSDMVAERLWDAAGISRETYLSENDIAIKKVEENRCKREGMLTNIIVHWAGYALGRPLASSVIFKYGIRNAENLQTLAKRKNPEESVYLLNGELIDRLRRGPDRGKRSERWVLPSEFAKAVEVSLKRKDAYEWTHEDAQQFSLRYNEFGLLGADDPSYNLDTPPSAVPSFEIRSLDLDVPTALAVHNLELWRRLGVFVPDAKPDRLTSMMDAMVIHHQTLARPGMSMDAPVELEAYRPPKACRCEAVTIDSNPDWFLALSEGYVAKQVGWHTMVELVRLRPSQMCLYHTQQLGNVLGLETVRIKIDDLNERLDLVYDKRAEIDHLRISTEFYSWFKPHTIAKKARQMKTLDALAYGPPLFVASKLLNRLETCLSSPLTEHAWVKSLALHVQTEVVKDNVMSLIQMYRHHCRWKQKDTNFLHTCYFSPMQQFARADLRLWQSAVSARLDGEFRLLTVPFPMMEYTPNGLVDQLFVYGNAMDIFGLKKTDSLRGAATAFVFHDRLAVENRARSFKVLGEKANAVWSEESVKAFPDAKLFDNGSWQSMTSKAKYRSLKYATKNAALEWKEVDHACGLLAPGAIVKVGKSKGVESLYASVVPYTAVRFDKAGKPMPHLENGMSYAAVLKSHQDLVPILDENVSKGGRFVMPGFPIDVRIAFSHVVEQALVGILPWNHPLVEKAALELLQLPRRAFGRWYDAQKDGFVSEFAVVYALMKERELSYKGNSFFAYNQDQNRPSPSIDDEFAILSPFSLNHSEYSNTPLSTPTPSKSDELSDPKPSNDPPSPSSPCKRSAPSSSPIQRSPRKANLLRYTRDIAAAD